jgi:hypothetical protein
MEIQELCNGRYEKLKKYVEEILISDLELRHIYCDDLVNSVPHELRVLMTIFIRNEIYPLITYRLDNDFF